MCSFNSTSNQRIWKLVLFVQLSRLFRDMIACIVLPFIVYSVVTAAAAADMWCVSFVYFVRFLSIFHAFCHGKLNQTERTNERNGERKGDRERTKESKVPSIYAWLLPIFVQARVFKYSYEFLKSLTNQLAINSITLLWPTQNVLYSCISRYFDGLPR